MTTPQGIRIFDGAVAIVTGGASGIGAALGKELATRGCEVVLADVQSDLAQQVAAEIQAKGGKATGAQLDVTDGDALEALVQTTVSRTGRLDYMFNNAGIAIGGLAKDHQRADWDRIIAVNLRGVVYGVHAAYPVMIKQGFGHIINTASMAGLISMAGLVGYSMTKHAVVGLSKCLRIEAALQGIRVSVLCPGVIRTPIFTSAKLLGELAQATEQTFLTALERLRPQEPADFARKAINAVAKNKAVIIVPGWWGIAWWLERASLTLALFLARQSFIAAGKELEKQ